MKSEKNIDGSDVMKFGVCRGLDDLSAMKAAKEAGAATLNYGSFISGVINFIVMALVVFMIVKVMNNLKKEEPAPAPAAPTTKKCPYCKSDISLDATRCPHCTSSLE